MDEETKKQIDEAVKETQQEAVMETEPGEMPEAEAPEIEGEGPPAKDWLLVVFSDDQPWAFRVQTSRTLIPSHMYAVSGWLETEAQDQQRRSKQLQEMARQKEAALKQQDAKDLAAMMADPNLTVKEGERLAKIPTVKKSRRRKR